MTLAELRQRTLIRLGSPVINVEIAPEQIDVMVGDAINRFIEVHYDGLDEGVVFLQVTPGTKEYTLPTNVHSVMEIMTTSAGSTIDEPLLVHPNLVGNHYVGNYGGGYGSGAADLTGYQAGYSGDFSFLDMELYRQYMATWSNYLEEQTLFQYNSTTGKLTLFVDPPKAATIALKIHSAPETLDKIYENEWVQKYTAALCKILWGGFNIGKFEGATLPGGVSLNFQQILSEGKEEKEFLETELYERYQEPVDFFFA
jgi:hypothetical protein